jgi:Spy/CpxP family protein refolding chaperone
MLAKKTITGLLVALMSVAAPIVWADNGPDADSSHQKGWHHENHEQMLKKVLNLTDDQVKQLKDSRETQMKTMKSVFEQMKSNREAFDAEIVKATPDMSKINDIQAQLKTIQAQMVDNHLNSLLAIRKILTPEQFAGYMALESARKMMMHHGHGSFDHKGGNMHKHWGDKSDKDSNDSKD